MTFKRWTNTAAVALLLLSPILISAAVEYDPESAKTIELTIEAEDNYYVETLELNKCHNTFSLADTSKYNAIGAEEDDMGINFYLDDKCEEYDFSILSQVTEYQGAFAGLKYTGEYKGAKTGFYENREFSGTVFPDAAGTPDEPVTAPGTGGAGTGTGTKPAEGTSTALAGLAADGSTTWVSPSAGLAVGMGIIGTIVVAGIVALGVFVYRRRGKHGDGRAFMTLSTGRDDYDEETGLAGENGPHSSALMQSRVGVSFDDDRYPSNYRDEAEKSDDDDDDEVGLGGYPQVPEGPTQYSHEPGTLPQNLRAP
ncbi:hypothetical protein BGZ96_006591 [Linnemannia gamsii]|uniref:Mid2 domain-containing protein n=1 Tax=Linnemannia gamsii TaxID=64522 RepID=A0ABQ7KGL0_9FUNG|nr:hypothetical protein BGZ96_006591 [Linnemannia gamsii]